MCGELKGHTLHISLCIPKEPCSSERRTARIVAACKTCIAWRRFGEGLRPFRESDARFQAKTNNTFWSAAAFLFPRSIFVSLYTTSMFHVHVHVHTLVVDDVASTHPR